MSGAITGGSKLNRDLAYRFGTHNDLDESNPIKQRLTIIEEALNKSDSDLHNKTNTLHKFNFDQREIIEDCASFKKEIEVNQKSLKTITERIDEQNSRLNKLNNDNCFLKKELSSIKVELIPLNKKSEELENILQKNNEINQKSSLITFNNDFDNLDKKLTTITRERDGMLEKRNQFLLTQERLKNELN